MRGTQSRKLLAILASTASMLSATAAMAQSAPGTPAAAAHEPDTQSSGLQDIIVTAQRRSENIQNVPISITAADADALATARVENIANISAISPSISFRVTNNPASSSNVIIRGLGTTGNNRSFEGSVGIFIDGVYRSRAASALQNFLDIENLQVLRGPQGTLFGKNTTAGALLLSSAAPNMNRVEGLVDIGYSNYNTLLARGAVSMPVSETLSFRVAAMASTRDGYFTDSTTGRTLNNDHSQAIKAQLRFEPSADLSIRLIGDYSISAGNCCYATAEFVDGANQALVDELVRANGRVVPSKRMKDYSATLNASNRNRIEDYGGTALITIGAGDGEIRSVSAIRKFTVAQRDADADFTGADLLRLDESFSSRFISQELTYSAKIASLNADLILGGFFSDEKQTIGRSTIWGTQAQTFWDRRFAFLPAGTTYAPAGLVSSEAMRGRSRSYAAFGHVDFAVGSNFNVIAGLRYSIEEKSGRFGYNYYESQPNAIFKVLGVSPGPSYDTETTDKALSGTFGLQYRPFEGGMLYATYNRGFKAGGVNLDSAAAGTIFNNPAQLNALPASVRALQAIFAPTGRPGQPLSPIYRPEKVNAYEIGAKIEYFDRRARTNIALFYYDITDVQIAQFLGLQYTVINASAAKDYGLEFENLFQVTPSLSLGLDGTWLPHAKYAADGQIAAVLAGSRFRFAPKFQGNATVNLDQPITDDMNLVARVQYQYSGRALINTASLTGRPATNMINGNLGVSFKSGLSVEGWVQNLTNEVYPAQTFATPLQGTDENAYLAPPRTYGVRLRARF